MKYEKNFWKSFALRIIFIIFFTTLSLSLSIYFLMYNQYYGLTMNNLKNDAYVVHQYTEGILSESSFSELNTIEDEQKEIYLTTYKQLNEIRNIANILYLYTAKQNENGDYIYVADGWNPNADDFRHIGDPIEEEIIPALARCLNGEVVLGDKLMPTDWGVIYVAYFPVHNSNGRVIGAIGMEFDCEELYNAIARVRIITIVLSLAVAVVFAGVAVFASKKVSEPFYKKLAYRDALTGLSNRMAFEESLKKYGKYLKDTDKLTLIIFDLNDLKRINDTMGHHMGDIYIKNSVKAITHALRELGETYRIGGDEFSTIVIGHTAEDVRDALRALYEKGRPVLKDKLFDCAFGMATYDPVLDKNLHDLLCRADEKMYEHKKRGKEKFADCGREIVN